MYFVVHALNNCLCTQLDIVREAALSVAGELDLAVLSIFSRPLHSSLFLTKLKAIHPASELLI